MGDKKIKTGDMSLAVAERQPLIVDDKSGIDMVEIAYLLLENWKSLLLAFLVGATLMGVIHTFFVKPTYQASTDLYITSSSSMISLQDLQIGSALTQDYQSIITSRQVLNKVIQDLGLNIDYKGLKKLISVNNPSGTHIIRTRVTTDNLALSRDIANDMLLVSIDRIYQIVGTSEPSIIDYSEAEAVEDVMPRIENYMGMGGIAFALMVTLFLIVRMMMDTTIKSDDDVEKYLQLPVLSAVPYFKE